MVLLMMSIVNLNTLPYCAFDLFATYGMALYKGQNVLIDSKMSE